MITKLSDISILGMKKGIIQGYMGELTIKINKCQGPYKVNDEKKWVK